MDFVQSEQLSHRLVSQKDPSREGKSCGLDVKPEVAFRAGQKRKISMRKLCIAIALLGGLSTFSAFASYDGTINFAASTHQSGSGGEFNAVTLGSGLGNFATFCVEENENIGQPPSGTYNYIINSGAVKGGPGATAIDPNTGLVMDPISIGTAWLYSQFRAGTLTLANGSGSYFDANETANAGLLQNAIWLLEGEGGSNNGYVALATTAALAAGYASVNDDSLGKYGVVVLNLYTGPANGTPGAGNLAQDQLALVPEPTTIIAGALLLLPFGASTLRFFRKYRKS